MFQKSNNPEKARKFLNHSYIFNQIFKFQHNNYFEITLIAMKENGGNYFIKISKATNQVNKY
jgi:hypothetical protein